MDSNTGIWCRLLVIKILEAGVVPFKCTSLRTGSAMSGASRTQETHDACILLHSNLKYYLVFKYTLIKKFKGLENCLSLLVLQEISFLPGASSVYPLKFTSPLPSPTTFLPPP